MSPTVPAIGTAVEVRYYDRDGDYWVAANVTFRYAACRHGHDLTMYQEHAALCEDSATADVYFRWEAIDLVDDEIATGEAYVSERGNTWRLMYPDDRLPYEPPTLTRVHPVHWFLSAVKRLFLPAAPRDFTAKPEQKESDQ